jgi:CheY-like chemotaxis protein
MAPPAEGSLTERPHPARPIAHALGNLLAVILGQAEFLLHRGPTDVDPLEERECLEAIRQAALSGRDRLRDLQRVLREEPSPAEARPPAARSPERDMAARRPPASAGGRVLVIDDEVEVRGMIASLLRQVGYEVDTAEDGPTGLEAARRRRFDCVIVDLEMPGLSGLAAARVLKDRAREVFVVLLTGDETGVDPREYEAAGIDRRMAKPFDRDELLATVHAACAGVPRSVP